MEDVAPDLEGVVELPAHEPRLERREAGRVVELVAVDAEDPDVVSGERGDEVVRAGRMPHAVEGGRDRQRLGEARQDLRRAVAGAVVDEEQLVAEGAHVPHRPLDEEVLVANEEDPHDSRAAHPAFESMPVGSIGRP